MDDVDLSGLECLGDLRPAPEQGWLFDLETLIGVEAFPVSNQQRRGVGDREVSHPQPGVADLALTVRS
jgi:hypothetical protein